MTSAGPTYLPVVDIAFYQGDINFARLAEAGVAGVIARASDGWRSGADPRWYEYAAGATAAGLPLGSYWYVRPIDDETAEQQAARWLDYVAEAEAAGARVAFLMVDAEWYWRAEGSSPLPAADAAEWLRRHIAELRRLQDRPVIVYTSAPFWNTYVGDPALAADLEFVLARYPRNDTAPPSSPADWEAWALGTGKRPALPTGATGWAGWQFTSSLRGPDVGIEATRVDANLIAAAAWHRWTTPVGDLAPAPAPAGIRLPPTPPPALPTPPTSPKVVKVLVSLPQLSTSSPHGDKHVKQLQTLVNLKAGKRLKVDGIFGPKTEGAVIDWQKFLNLIVDGIVGPQTWQSVIEA